jgi:DNA-binding beta-propeller fold protein YncE
VLAFNHSGKNATVIDAAAGKAVGTVELGGMPEVGRADGKGTVWVNLEDTSEVVRIDSKKMAVTARWKLAPCEEPTGLAYDGKNGRLFVGCGNKMMAVLDATSGKVVTTVPIGPGVDGTEFDPATGLVFNSCGGDDGTLAVVKRSGPDKYVALESVATQPRAKTLAVDSKTHKVFLSAARFEAPPPGQKRGKMVPGSFAVLVYGH